jgi:hypothetical protein
MLNYSTEMPLESISFGDIFDSSQSTLLALEEDTFNPFIISKTQDFTPTWNSIKHFNVSNTP